MLACFAPPSVKKKPEPFAPVGDDATPLNLIQAMVGRRHIPLHCLERLHFSLRGQLTVFRFVHRDIEIKGQPIISFPVSMVAAAGWKAHPGRCTGAMFTDVGAAHPVAGTISARTALRAASKTAAAAADAVGPETAAGGVGLLAVRVTHCNFRVGVSRAP